MKRYRQVAAFILAGGASSRMGRDKGLLDLGGVPLIVRTARLIEPLVARVTVVGSPRMYRPLGLRAIEDRIFEGRESKRVRGGPLAGIATALSVTRSPWNLIVACDLPYLSRGWLDWLLSRAMKSRAQAFVPRTAGGLEPLAAVYRREAVAAIGEALAHGRRKVTGVIEQLSVDVVQEREWRSLDPHVRVLKNMNAPEDYAEAVEWWRAEGSLLAGSTAKARAARNRVPGSAGPLKQSTGPPIKHRGRSRATT